MNKIFLLLGLSILPVIVIHAQVITGKVSDRKTREPLAYVHIGIAGKNLGTISRENGAFSINLTQAGKEDTLTFSMIGYEKKKLPIAGLDKNFLVVKMKKSTFLLKEIVIKGDKIREQLKFGRTKPTKTTTGASGIEEYGIGQEAGTTIKNDGNHYQVMDINFHHRWNTLDSILYRINIYSLQDQQPQNSILHKELFVKAYKREKWITKQIENQTIFFDQDVFISIEIVRRWDSKNGKTQLFYSHGEGQREYKSFIRITSQGNWTTDLAIPLTLYITAEKVD